MTTPTISIVVCTFNRAVMLRQALASLYDLVTDGQFTYEIVVVNNASRDNTSEVISDAAAQSKNSLRGVYEPAAGIVAARNRGIREARGSWIAFFDDDQLADSRWLMELYQGARDRQCRVVGGSVQLALPEDCQVALHSTIRMLLGEAIHGSEPMPYGGRLTPGCGNLMIERTVFEEVGLFERTISGRGEDTDLFSRIERAGIAAWYLPSAIIQHLTPQERLQPAYLLKLAGNMGIGIAERQAAQRSRLGFAAILLAKAVRLAVWQAPALAWAALFGNRQSFLGCRCLLAINWQFLRAGLSLLRQPSVPTYAVTNDQIAALNTAPLLPPVDLPPPHSATPSSHRKLA